MTDFQAAPETQQDERQVLRRTVELLASATDFDHSLGQTIRACLPALGDFGFFDVVTPAGVRRTVAAHEDPELEALLATTGWVRQEHADGLNLCALTTGEPAFHPGIDDAWHRQVAANGNHLALLRQLAFRSMLTVPVRYRDELLGALTLFMGRSGRQHTAAHLVFAGELAAPVVANARLLQQHEQAEAALRRSGEQLRLALEAGEIGIWDWDIATNQVAWSDRVYELHGLPVGTDQGGFDGWRRSVHPADQERVTRMLQAALDGGAPYDVEFRVCLPDGQERWLTTRGQLVRDAAGRPLRMVGATSDTTERVALLAAERAARAEAEAAGRRMAQLAQAGAALARSLDVEDILQAIATSIVPALADWCRIDLLDDEGVLQRRVAFHKDPERAQQALEMAQLMHAAPQTTGSMAWCIEHGRDHWGRFDEPPATEDPALSFYTRAFGMRAHYILPLVARGRTIGAMGVVQAESGRDLEAADRALLREMGHRAALALDNARLYGEAESARRQAEAASRAKDEFLAVLGHELRNPLAPIATALELMARRDAHAHTEERRIVARQVAHLSRLIDDLLDVSRITQGKVELKRAPVDLKAIVVNALEQTQAIFERRQHSVQLKLQPGPAVVEGDAVRLTQVLCNLLVNAAKFTPADKRVTVELQVEPGWVELAVQDEGRGIPPELLPRVFDAFVQGRQSLDRQAGGLGLGLAIVRMLVQLHGGAVTATSAGEGRGSRFVVRLPGTDQVAQDTGPRMPADDLAGGASGRILLVDDNADAAETLSELLRMMGYDVRCASNGEAALALLDSFPAQLGLLDIGLPGLDGYQLAQRIRGRPGGAAMKLVALTGYGRDNDRARALAARFDEHLVKPVDVERLLQVLQQLLG